MIDTFWRFFPFQEPYLGHESYQSIYAFVSWKKNEVQGRRCFQIFKIAEMVTMSGMMKPRMDDSQVFHPNIYSSHWFPTRKSSNACAGKKIGQWRRRGREQSPAKWRCDLARGQLFKSLVFSTKDQYILSQIESN
jgi:hypothetical protein